MRGERRLDLSPCGAGTNNDRLVKVIITHRIHMGHVKMKRVSANGLPAHTVPDA